MLAEKEITVAWDESVYTYLMKHGVDAQFGARPLRRAITKYIVNILSQKLLDGSLIEGQSVIVKYDKEELQVLS